MSARRVLLLTRNFPPLRGGMERLNLEVARSLARRGFEVCVVAPPGGMDQVPEGVRVIRTLGRSLTAFLAECALRACAAAITRRPVLVIAGSGLCAPVAWLAARLCGARYAVYVHGLDLVVRNAVYRRCWLPFVRKADCVMANSNNTMRLAHKAGVPAERTFVLFPGTRIPVQVERTGRTRRRIGAADGPLLLSVGRMTPRKGLAEFVRDVMPLIAVRHPDVVLLIIGDDAQDALLPQSRGGGRGRVIANAQGVGLSSRLRILGPCDERTLEEAYEDASVHVFPLRSMPDDVEGFGMVAVEAAARGLPTVANRVGGVPDAVLDGVTGTLVQEGDHEGFAEAVSKMIDRSNDPAWRQRCREAARAFGWERFESELADRVNELVLSGEKEAR